MKNYMNQRNERRLSSCMPMGASYDRMRSSMNRGTLNRDTMKRDPVNWDNKNRNSSLGNGVCPLRNRSGSCGQTLCGQSGNRRSYPETLPENVPNIPSVEEGCGCGCGQSDQDCAKVKKQLQTVDFALCEVILYLDAYPEDHEALNTYHMLLSRRQKLVADFESLCGPLTAYGNVSTTSWDWVKGSATWEYRAD